ncbi:MAG TPA: GNAT family N-acetyltransferase [Bryobacterales bacterium]|nr:GNAT family N-acetyltransferase [Bryobacterales bacterium]
MELRLRPAAEADIADCGRIIYEAFKGIAEAHGFAPDIPDVEAGQHLADVFIRHPSFYGVVAESGGRIVGSNFLDERGAIRGVGPITVDPAAQRGGVGRALMRAVIDRGQGAPGIRLLQDAFNTLSMPLYASLGFDTKEPIAFVKGTPRSRPSAAVEVRPMKEEDLDACARLCRRAHGFDRTNELSDNVRGFSPYVALRGGRLTAYGVVAFFGHGVAETEQDMKDLLLGVAADAGEISFLLPTRQAGLFRWCLSEGMRVVKPMTLMAIGEYQEPQGCWFPSVLY